MAGIEHMDRHERAAIQQAVNATIAIAAPKQIFGETLGAGGALAMAAALAWLDDAPPSCLVSGTAPTKRVDTILVTSMGYYGNASALVMRRARTG